MQWRYLSAVNDHFVTLRRQHNSSSATSGAIGEDSYAHGSIRGKKSQRIRRRMDANAEINAQLRSGGEEVEEKKGKEDSKDADKKGGKEKETKKEEKSESKELLDYAEMDREDEEGE